MDRHKRRDLVGPLVFGLSVVLASFTVVVGTMLEEGPLSTSHRLALLLRGRAFDVLMAGSVLSTVAYAVVYPIYVRRRTTRGASKPHPVAHTLWRLSLGALFMFIAFSMYELEKIWVGDPV
jgi:hypothetical protein